MSDFFKAVDKIKPAYDATYKFVLLICKLLLIGDIAITTMAVAGRYISFIPDPAWSEEIVLTFMAYMAVLSAALAIRRGAHIRMTAFDPYLPKGVVRFLDVLSDIAVLRLAVVVSKFWHYFPIPLAGVAMLIFELEALYNHIKAICLKEDPKEVQV